MKQFKNKLFASVLCMVLIVAMALSMTACSNNTADDTNAGQDQVQTVEKSFAVVVVDKDGNETTFDYTSDAATVGEALVAEGLIAGTDSEYGLMVTEVNGIVADYNIDQTYWAFYIDGEYASAGVDFTELVDGSTYSFKVEK